MTPAAIALILSHLRRGHDRRRGQVGGMTMREKLPSKDALADSEFVSRETWNGLRLMPIWSANGNRRINLISPKTLPDLWDRHILDSLQLYLLKPSPRRWPIIGSGAGFPGLVTAICLIGDQ
jgi:16S rRNA (guanine527-N7)-methyltransferase